MLEVLEWLGVFWTAVLIGVGLFALVCGLVGAWVSDQVGRPTVEGWWLGVFFGPLGLILEACLPTGLEQRVLAAQEKEWQRASERRQVVVK